MKRLGILFALAVVGMLALPTTALAAPLCIVDIGDAAVAHWGALNAAVCADMSGEQLVYGRQIGQNWFRECNIQSSADDSEAWFHGYAATVYDLSFTGYSTATSLCNEAVALGYYVTDHVGDPYQ